MLENYLKRVSHIWHPLSGYCTDEGVSERVPGGRMLQVVIGASVYGVRNGRHTGRHPDDDHDANCPRQTGSRLCSE